ncbi:MAG: M13 family metallopeptidase [Bacteroidetes bacterium]|nr:M13 family metallopeptidase [Bacteroidota bacterium]
MSFASLLFIASCSNDAKKGTENSSSFVAFEKANFDTTVKPGDDFYQYANGGWLKKGEIPASESRWGSFDMLNDNIKKNLHTILDEAAAKKDATPGSVEQKVGDFYAVAMDSVKLNADGISPLKEELAKIEALKTPADVLTEIAHLHKSGSGSFFAAFVNQDAKKSDELIVQIYQSGLGLGDRDYYTKTDPESKSIQDAYLAHVTKMLSLAGEDEKSAAANAKSIMKLETELAKASKTRLEQRDPEANYHKMTMDELAKLTPSIDWKAYFASNGFASFTNLVVSQPEFLKVADKLIKSTPLPEMKEYLKWNLINSYADYLSDDFVMQNFDFFGRTLTGAKEMKPRWKRALRETDGAIGEALGQLYVAKHFSANAKKRINELVDNLMIAYKERLSQIDWMSPETKTKALEKLAAIDRKLSFPDTWKDYTSLDIKRDSYVQNTMRAQEFAYNRNINKLGKPVDRTEWLMSPQTVNAYYEPSKNEIVFPCGIMQFPFFDENADDAFNYGGIGAVIGHEITHGFDDEGSQFDAKGNLNNWFTEADKAKFKERTAGIVKQFNNYVAIDTMHVNGALTQGENIADLGGITISFAALQKALAGKEKETIDGFTPEQRFFLNYAQVWRGLYRDEALKRQLQTNPHSPGKFRTLGPLSNFQPFYDAFGVKEGDKMFVAESDRVKIW